MRGQRFYTVAVFAIIGVQPVSSMASFKDFCQLVLGRNLKTQATDRILDRLPRLQDVDLSRSVWRLLRNSASSELRAALRDRPVAIFGTDASNNLHPIALGEGVQAQFVIKAMRAIQPRVRLVYEPSHEILLHDPWQSRHIAEPDRSPSQVWLNLASYHALAMPLLKAANALHASLPTREQLRRRVSADTSLRIASLYTYRIDSDIEGMSYLLGQVSRNFDVIFISDSRATEFLNSHRFLAPGQTVRRLSELTAADLKKSFERRLIVLNDTIGYVPQLHALANIAIVRGPIDFLAPLQSGTPTLVINDEFSSQRYNQQGFSQLRSLAEGTQAARFFAHSGEVRDEDIQQLLNIRDFRRPYQLPVAGTQTPISLFVQALNVQFLRR